MRTTVKTQLNYSNIANIEEKMLQSLIETADATRTDLAESQTMPFDSGNMQNRSMFIDVSKIYKKIVSIVVDTPYARRLYWHPEYKFRKDKNPNAGGMWFHTYMIGPKDKFCQNAFKRILGSKLK